MPFFPDDRAIPEQLSTPAFVLSQLRESVAAIDFEAFKNSPDVISVHSGGLWPVAEYTLAEEQRDLALHEVRHREKRDFAFIIRTPDETAGLGCVYILPLFQFLRHFPATAPLQSEVTEASAIITFWVRQDRQDTPLAAQVISAVHNWIMTEWPFDDHVFRVNPDEHASIQALEQCGFKVRFEVTMDESPYHYLFFGKDAPGNCTRLSFISV
jgi:RimJ/RimL family protein N-acetyltransferase